MEEKCRLTCVQMTRKRVESAVTKIRSLNLHVILTTRRNRLGKVRLTGWWRRYRRRRGPYGRPARACL